MTLAETCDRIEAALADWIPYDQLWPARWTENNFEMHKERTAHLRTLVELGGWQLKEHRAMGEAYNWDRFEALKVRVAEAVGK